MAGCCSSGATNVAYSVEISGSKSRKPVVVVSHRVVQAGKKDEFNKAYGAFADYLQANQKGVKSVAIYWDHKDPNLVHDIQWFSDLPTFYSHADMNDPKVKELVMGFMQLYDPNHKFTGEVYGDWDEKVV